jgi:hypothetical protein
MGLELNEKRGIGVPCSGDARREKEWHVMAGAESIQVTYLARIVECSAVSVHALDIFRSSHLNTCKQHRRLRATPSRYILDRHRRCLHRTMWLGDLAECDIMFETRELPTDVGVQYLVIVI